MHNDVAEHGQPGVFNHNLETVRALYRNVRPGADYEWSLDPLTRFKAQHQNIPTKSGIMVGLGEGRDQVAEALRDLRARRGSGLSRSDFLSTGGQEIPAIRRFARVK